MEGWRWWNRDFGRVMGLHGFQRVVRMVDGMVRLINWMNEFCPGSWMLHLLMMRGRRWCW